LQTKGATTMKISLIEDHQKKSNTLIIGIFLFFYFCQLLYWLPNDIAHGINAWAYTDWLIDYSAGFVRRGLSGVFIDFLSMFVQPTVLISVTSWIIFTLVILGYLRLIVRSISHLSPYLLTALLFLPSLLPFYLHDHGAFGRKEILGFLTVLLHLYSLETLKDNYRLKDYVKKVALPITVLLPLLMLIHENTLLLFVPTHLMISLSVLQLCLHNNWKKMLFYLIVIYLPVLAIFVVIVLWGQPSFETALAICKKWEALNALDPGSCPIPNQPPTWALPGALSALAWSFAQAASLPLSFSRRVIAYWMTLFGSMSFLTLYFGMRTVMLILKEKFPYFNSGLMNRYKRFFGYKYFLFPFLVSTPLYLLGWDWGRWFSVTCINYAIVALSGEIAYVEGRLIEQFGDNESKQVFMPLHDTFYRYIIELFLLLSAIFFIRVPHCCNDGLNMVAEPLQSLIRKIFELL